MGYKLTFLDHDNFEVKLGVPKAILVERNRNVNKRNQGLGLDNDIVFTNVFFHKEIYQPGCVEFTIQFKANKLELSGSIDLMYDDHIIAKNYYIFEKITRGGYVTYKAYSLDKFLTIDKFNRAHTGKCLVNSNGTVKGIVQSVFNNVKTGAFDKYKALVPKVKIDGKDTGLLYVNNLNHLYYGEKLEPLLPYSVQYDESFYDFLVRMCNRYGEFLYFEDGKLHIGLEAKTSKNMPEGLKEEECYESCVDFSDEPVWDIPNYLTDNYFITDGDTVGTLEEAAENAAKNTKDYKEDEYEEQGYASLEDSEDYDKRMLQTSITNDEMKIKSMKSFGEVRSNRGIGAEEFFEPIRNEQYAKMSDYTPPLSTFFDGLKSFAEHRTLYSAMASTAIKESFRFGISAKFRDDINGTFDALYKGGKYEFSDCESKQLLVINKYYTEVCKREEEAEKGKKILKYSTYQNLLLGDVIDNKWVVYSVKGGTKGAAEDPIEVLLVPKFETGVFPLPLWEKHVRKASPQRAFVVFNFDPDRLGRVRVKYPWQYMGVYAGKYGDKSAATMKGVNKREDATPWIRVAYPMASNGSGFMFFPAENDEVLIDYEDGNIERPFVSGSFYNINNQPAIPADMHMAGVTKSITSANGHHIKFQDITGYKFVSELLPFLPILAKFGILSNCEGNAAAALKDFAPHLRKYLGGGFEIGDYLGVYSIKGTTHSRNITISSPVGDIVLDAFTGITINAPHGDVNIVGKNVNIEARNNLTMTSGTNINHTYWGKGEGPKGLCKDVAWNIAGMIPIFEGGLMKILGLDFSHMRTILEVLLRPIGGTMLIKSYRFMCVEAGKGDTSLRKTSGDEKEFIGLKNEIQNMRPIINEAISNLNSLRNIVEYIRALKDMLHKMSFQTNELDFLQDILSGNVSDSNEVDIYGIGDDVKQYWKDFFDVYKVTKEGIDALRAYGNDSECWKTMLLGLEDYWEQLSRQAKHINSNNRIISILYDYSKFGIPENKSSEKKLIFQTLKAYLKASKYLKGWIVMDESKINWDNFTDVANQEAIQLKYRNRDMFKKKMIGAPLKTLGFMGFCDDFVWRNLDDGGIIYSVDKKKAYIMKDQGPLGFNGSSEQYVTKLNVVGKALITIKEECGFINE